MVVHQWPRKLCSAQVCYLQELLPCHFQPPRISILTVLADLYQIYIFYVLHLGDSTYQI